MSERIKVKQMSERIYLMDDAGESTGYLVVGDDKALVIDTMNGLGDVKAVVRSITELPIIVANTHGHCDHIYGNVYFEEAYLHPADLPIGMEHSNFPEFIQECKKYGVTMPPWKEINDGDVIELGGATLDVIHLPGHTPGGICLLLREERVLFTGDGINCHLWMQLDESLPIKELVRNLEKIMYVTESADRILHGHAQGYEDISLLKELYEGAKELIEHPELSKLDKEYHWFGGVGKQHAFGDGTKVICYGEEKLHHA